MFFVFLSFKHALESPPHVRGKAMDKLCGLRTLGITPACAGKRPDDTKKNRLK